MAKKVSDSPDFEGDLMGGVDAAIYAGLLRNPVLEGPGDRRFALVPDTFRLNELFDPARLPPHVGASVRADDRASLIAYVNRFSDRRSAIFADYDKGQIGAILDYHDHNKRLGEEVADCGAAPGSVDHRATLVLRDSEEFKRWAGVEGKMLEQAEFAAFLEENAEDIVAPEPTVMIEISRDLEATTGTVFKSSTRLENGDRAFRYETETRTLGEVVVPREFRLSIPLYQGEEPVELRCAFRWRVTGGGLLLGFEWRRVEYQRQAWFARIAHEVAEETGCPVFLGAPRL